MIHPIGIPVVPSRAEMPHPEHERTAPARPLVDSEYIHNPVYFMRKYEPGTFADELAVFGLKKAPWIEFFFMMCERQ